MVNINRKILVAGGALYIGMSTATYMYIKTRENPDGLQHAQEKYLPYSVHGNQAEEKRQRGGQNDLDARVFNNRKEVFDKIADLYDSSIDTDELLMGLKLLRRWLLRNARGDVLEVSAGTGRNLPYYDKIRSLTMIDSSREMLLQAWDKYSEELETKRKKKSNFLPTIFALADVERLTDVSKTPTPPVKKQSSDRTKSRESERNNFNKNEIFSINNGLTSQKMIQPPSDSDIIEFTKDTNLGKRPDLKAMKIVPAGTYDTVVDTFGLCSCDDPVLALKEMARALKPGGKILLLEHGISSWKWLNKILDSHAAAHYTKWGCQWNRDILQIVHDAGLQIESESRWHFGTTYMLTCVQQ